MKLSPASAAEAREEIRTYLAGELERAAADIQTKVIYNTELPWVDGRKQICYLVEWAAANGPDGVALAGPYTYTLPDISSAEAKRLGSLHEWRQQLLNLYAGCEIVVQARLKQPLVDVPDPTRTKQLLEALQNPAAPRIAVNCSVREFIRIGTDEYYIFNGDWVHNPNFSYTPTFGFKPRKADPTLELPAPEDIQIKPHKFLTPVPAIDSDGALPGEAVGFIMVKNGQVVDASCSPLARSVVDKVAMFYFLGKEHGPFAITLT
ncbi:hypothetical protein MTX78_10715 [Hymenobacter tibetensis]|uniref:Uncharacterized protein n=1 Tax=Hymenobacter tibetensis TaxID=497967 RepID=A0ABY4D3U2_9BACT|nr:hypothetical protein [Hymenobacter tibetensis]UOG77053.1 hypothetical protein MTX78_10715 [Hymenobacter tibetensis]